MRIFYAALALTIAGNVLYHLSQKSTPAGVHPIVSIVASYTTAIVLSLMLLIAFPMRDSLRTEIGKLNWASYGLGLAILGVEIGFLLSYRAGWRVSIASVSANTAVALILIPIGIVLFRERLTPTNALGIVLCVAGLVLVMR